MYAEPPNNTRFKPGQSGNPNGRPKEIDTKDMLDTIQQIITIYTATQSKYLTIRIPAQQRLKKVKETLSS